MSFFWLSCLPLTSFAEEGTYLGGGADTQVGATGDGLIGQSQAELDLRWARGPVYLRLDADTTLSWSTAEPARFSWTPPEWAMAQVGDDAWRGRLGVLNPQIGYEDWDAWLNPLPTWSVMFNAATPGRILGAELERSVTADAHLFTWAGLDLDWTGRWNQLPPSVGRSLGAGIGLRGEWASWSTWSGLFAVPQDGFYAAVYTFDLYPSDGLTLLIDGSAGWSGPAPFGGGQLVATLLPEGRMSPVVRLEGVLDPAGRALGGWAAGVPAGTGSLGVRSQPVDSVLLLLEAKGIAAEGALFPQVWLGVELVRPEPGPYSVDPNA